MTTGCPLHSLPHRRRFWQAHAPSVREEIASLDAVRDCQRIVHLLYAHEFPFDLLRSTELALFHTYGSRTVSGLLDRTAEFANRGQKRYDDTRLLIGQFMECGWDGELGKRSIAQMNHIHSFFSIRNEDYLFVLWTFIEFPVKWMADFAWRGFTPHEEAAWFHYWCEIGRRMGMTDIPPDKAAFDAFVAAYETREFVYDPANQRVADSTMRVMAAWLPWPLRGLVRWSVLSLVPERLHPAIGHTAPPRWFAALVRGALRLRGRLHRRWPLERAPKLLGDHVNRTYPGNSYDVESLGPPYAKRPD
jgi:hypothetical protein